MQKTIIFLLLILKSILLESQNISSGLYFAAHGAIKEERTSLTLSPDFDASKGFTLDFDIKFRLITDMSLESSSTMKEVSI